MIKLTDEQKAELIKLHNLYERIQELFDEVGKIRMATEDRCKDLDPHKAELIWKDFYKLIDPIDKESSKLLCEYTDLKRKLFLILPAFKIGEEIELRKSVDEFSIEDFSDLVGEYKICLSATKQIVGKISYRGYHTQSSLADVGYAVDSKYRGHAYAYKALCLLGELLKENGIDDFWISVLPNNLASVKTIEKYGATYMKDMDGAKLFSCKTFMIDEIKRG